MVGTLVKGEALVSLCSGHAAMAIGVQALHLRDCLATIEIPKYGPQLPGCCQMWSQALSTNSAPWPPKLLALQVAA